MLFASAQISPVRIHWGAFLRCSLLAGLCLVAIAASARDTFDVLTFVPPQGWARDAGPNGEMVRFAKQDATGNAFAMITIFRSMAAGADSKANFDTAWAELARKPLDATAAQMSGMNVENGWEIQTGSAPFQKDRLSGVVLLSTASAENKMANVLVVTNSTAFQGEIGNFIASLQLAPVGKDPAKAPPVAPAANSGEKPEVWYSYRATLGTFTYNFTFVAILPNGDVLGSIPSEGMFGVNRATRPQYRWGKRKVAGNEVHFDYGEFGLTRMEPVADGKMSYPPGSKSTFYYRLKSVDGLRIDGEFASDSPDWHRKGKPADIVFHSDGSFINHSVVTEIYDGSGKQLGTKDSGRGIYEIRDFTILLKYSDGTVARRPFYLSADDGGGPLPNAILMGSYPHYRRKD